jgi:hypothetical protein
VRLSRGFTNTPLIAIGQLAAGTTTSPIANPIGDSEPAIVFGSDGSMAVDGLGWLPYQVNLWRGSRGATPTYFGAMAQNLPIEGGGRTKLGDEDADVAIISAGTLLLGDLL